ncbi:MAG: hypothetical protein JSS27_06710 [Planctomycetes bacterium]|nr:hypothetical protein [Planctomycetota bacterium]
MEKNRADSPAPVAQVAEPAETSLALAADVKPAPAPALVELVAEAKKDFHPVSKETLEERLAELRVAVVALDKPLGRSKSGKAWREYLDWDKLVTQTLSVETADTAVLRGLLHKLTAPEEGLEWHRFVDVAEEIRDYLFALESARDPQAESNYQANLKTIEETLGNPKHEDRRRLNEAAAELDRDGYAPQLVAALRQQFSHPNMLVEVSNKLVSTGLSRPVDETAPLRDNIMGTQISGTGHTVGQVTGELVADDNRAVIQTVMTGVNHARTVGRNGPALIYSRGESQLSAKKQLILDSEGLRGLPTEAVVKTRTQITGIGSTKKGVADCLVKKIAAKQVPKRKAQGEAVAQQHARAMFARRFNAQAEPLITNANDRFQNRFRNPLVRMGVFPEHLHFSTTQEVLNVVSKQTPEHTLAANTPAPAIAAGTDFSFRLHESMVNNTALGMLAGRTLDKEQMDRLSLDMTGKLPEIGDDEIQKPWSITFADDEPVTMFVDDNVMVITIRGAKYTSDHKPFEAMNITARYKLARDKGRIEALRQGDLEIYPPDFKPNTGDKLSTRQVILKRMLQKRFSRIFRESIVSDGLELKGNWEQYDPLPANQLVADDGWLAIGWQQPDQPRRSAESE